MNLASTIYSIIIGGTASSALTELLKLPIVPIAAERYPRVTASVLSFLSAVLAFLIQGTGIVHNFAQLIATASGAFLLSAVTYNQALRGLKSNQYNQ